MFLLLSNETSLKKAFAIITVHRNGKILEKNYSTIINIGNKGDSILYCRLSLRFLFTLDRRVFNGAFRVSRVYLKIFKNKRKRLFSILSLIN